MTADMVGYWEDDCPVRVRGGGETVLASAFVHYADATFIAVANWGPDSNVSLAIDWSALGLSPNTTSLCAPQVVGVQTKLPQERPFGLWRDGDTMEVPGGAGLWLLLTTRPILTNMVLGRCVGQPPPPNAEAIRVRQKTDDDVSARLKPWWAWSWDTLPVWASGQGATDFAPNVTAFYADNFAIMWTCAIRFQLGALCYSPTVLWDTGRALTSGHGAG